LYDFNDTAADFPKGKVLEQLFREQVEKTPDSTAVVDRTVQLTYRELNEKAGRLAQVLKEKGVLPDNIIAIKIGRSIDMIIGIFGILKAGAAYLPIDPAYPPERIDFMLKDSNARVLLKKSEIRISKYETNSNDKNSNDRNEVIPCVVLDFEHLNFEFVSNFEFRASNLRPANLSYVIYTSGSTGTPKGVMIEHRAMMNRLNWMQAAYPLSGTDVILQKTPVVFDVSVWELFWWSFNGAGLCLLDPGGEKDPGAIVEAAGRFGVTTMHFVPSMLNAFLYYMESAGEKEMAAALNKLRSLRQVFSSGEALAAGQVKRFYTLFETSDRPRLINLYGPTEAAVDVSYFNCPRQGGPGTVPIGKPIHNIRLYVLDNRLHLQPPGVTGQLTIAGVGLARGYLNRPELTAEKFVFLSYKSYRTYRTYRFYKTGDLARWLYDGNIEYLGRMDQQVKIRGFRIELGEIEKQLTTPDSPPAREAVVTADTDASGGQRLIAYIVPDETHAYTVCRQLEIAGQGLADGVSFYQWPDEMPVYYINRGETDFMYREIFEERSYLKHGITLEDGDCIFDVGANIGVFSLFARHCCRNARIYAFEPLPPLYRVLSLNTSLYGGDVRTFNYGIGSADREVVFTYYPHASILSGSFADRQQETETVKAFMQKQEQEAAPAGTGEQVKLTEEQYNELLADRLTAVSYTCPVKTLSQVIEENNVETIDLLKIDVEKAEIDVLEGIHPDHWPRIRQLVIEVHESGNHRRLDRVTRLLEGNGYTVAVEQEDLLAETRLYNLYAGREPRRETGKQERADTRARDYYSVDRLVRDTRDYLESKLPDYMVPAHIVLLTRLPLTPSGKVDRNALPEPDIRPDKGYAAPTSDNERQIARVWQEVLGLEKVGINDDFFRLGGHSLKATTVISNINRLFGIRVPLVEMFKTPTIRGMAQYIEREGTSPETAAAARADKGLVLLKKKSAHAGNLFFIHDGSGEVEGYSEFIQRLTLEFNYWGIRADRLEDYAPRQVSIEEVAAKYIEKIKGIQPDGPYNIAGWSMGGTIAFEIVKQMEQRGDSIASFAMIDAVGPFGNVSEDQNRFSLESERNFVKKYIPDIETMDSIRDVTGINQFWSAVVGYLEAGHFDVEVIKKVITEFEAHVVPDYENLSIGELIKYLNVGRIFHQARLVYTPTHNIDTPVHYFIARQSQGQINEHAWQEYTNIPIKYHTVKGDHFTIFRMPGVVEFAALFDIVLDKAKTTKEY
jgi:amino acid adenylation domain-containing protein/FkbM family methyltransferase